MKLSELKQMVQAMHTLEGDSRQVQQEAVLRKLGLESGSLYQEMDYGAPSIRNS